MNGVELLGEPLQLLVGPVGVPGLAVFVLVVGLVIVGQRLDVGRDGRGAGIAVHAVVAGILVAEAHHRLVVAGRHLAEPGVEAAPVVLDRFALLAGHDLAGEAVGVFQRNGFAVGGVAVFGVVAPQHEAGGGLHGVDLALDVDGPEGTVGGGAGGQEYGEECQNGADLFHCLVSL